MTLYHDARRIFLGHRQENLVWILASYTTRALSTASIVQSLIYRAIILCHGYLMALRMLSVEHPWSARDIGCLYYLEKYVKKMCGHRAGARGHVVLFA